MIKMKRVLLIGVYFMLSTTFAQEQEGVTFVCAKPGQSIWIMGGLNYVFEPADELHDMRIDTSCDADDFIWTFLLNNMPVSLEQLIQVDLSSHHLSNDKSRPFNRGLGEGHGTYSYVFGLNTECPDSVICQVETDLPIYLNGVLIDQEQNSLRSLNPKKITTLKNIYMLFRGRRIYIEVEE